MINVSLKKNQVKFKIHVSESKQKHVIAEPVGYNESRFKERIIGKAFISKIEILIHLEVLGKKTKKTVISQISRWKETIKIRAKTDEMEMNDSKNQ